MANYYIKMHGALNERIEILFYPLWLLQFDYTDQGQILYIKHSGWV
jgi:hypothetical protein